MTECCYHCGEDVPSGVAFTLPMAGEIRQFCCAGCQAVAQCIADAGLNDYYRLRTERAAKPDEERADYRQFDDPSLLEAFSRREGDYWISRFSIGGLRCAACAWLIENHLPHLPGIDSVTVNLQQGLATVRWDPAQVDVSAIFEQFDQLGYQALPWSNDNRQALIQDEMDSLLRRLGVAGIGMMQVGMVAIGLYAGDFQGIDAGTRNLLRVFSLLVATPVLLYAAQPFFRSAWRSLSQRHLGMDVPVSIALGSAYIASVIATVTQAEHVYFDTISMFTFFLLVSRYLQLRVEQTHYRSGQLPLSARKISSVGDGKFEWVALKDLQIGDLVSVAPGELIPIDGVVLRGQSSVETSAFTGEFLPATVGPGDTALAGSGNLDGNLELRVTNAAKDSAWAKVDALLEQAQACKPRVAQIADRLASHFVLLVLSVSALSLAWWWQSEQHSAFLVALSVLVVSCPCALSLATPTSYTAAIRALRHQGVVLHNGQVLENIHGVSHIVFDKTGTLTEGRPRITASTLRDDVDAQQAMSIAATLEQYSRHPIASAFAQQNVLATSNVDVHSGKGISAIVNGERYRIGSADFCGVAPSRHSRDIDVFLCDEQGIMAHYQLADTLRSDAAALVSYLKSRHHQVTILSGDHHHQVEYIARQLGLDSWHAGCTAAQKLAHIHALQQQGQRIMMVGDGVNDAPVIAAADISVAMTDASDLTRAQADVVLLDNRLSGVELLFKTAHRGRRILRQNLGWALGYNLVSLPLAAAGLVPPWLAALGMSLSSLLVILNALRLSSPARDDRPSPKALPPAESALEGVPHG